MYHDREKHGKRIKAINNKLYLSTEKKRWRKNMKVLGISFGRKNQRSDVLVKEALLRTGRDMEENPLTKII
jgi:U3 small nucleolar RNA-associated protein 14